MKNNKGFTLVELLAVIVVLGIVGTIATFGVQKVMISIKTKMVETKEKEIIDSAILYGQDNKNNLTETCTFDEKEYNCLTIKVKELIEKGYIKTDEICNNNEKCLKNNLTDDPMNYDVKIYNDINIKAKIVK